MVTDALPHWHRECDFWASTFWQKTVRQPILTCLFGCYRKWHEWLYSWGSEFPRLFKVRRLCHASHQFSHAALLSNSVLTLVVKAHLAGLATEAMFRCVSRQEHHVLGRCALNTHRRTGNRFKYQPDVVVKPLWTKHYAEIGRRNRKLHMKTLSFTYSLFYTLIPYSESL